MKRSRAKTDQLVLLLAFLAIIASPATLLFHDIGRFLPGDNRDAAPFPRLVKNDGSLATREEIEGFVDDNIGFRTAAPRLDCRVMYDLFGAVLDTAELCGKDGNLFIGGDRRFPMERAPLSPLSEMELSGNGTDIKAASDYYKSKGVPFLFVTIPDKEEVYPELYPDTFLKRPDCSRLEQQVEWLTANTDVDAYDMTKALREKAAETGDMLWYEAKDNAHWNCMGAWYGYLEIMGRLKAYDPGLKTLSLDDFDVWETKEPYVSWDGEFAYRKLSDTVYTFELKTGFGGSEIENLGDPWIPQDRPDLLGSGENDEYFHVYNPDNCGTLVFFADSYVFGSLRMHFSETFEHVYFFRLPTDYQAMRPVLDMIGPDYVALEMVERMYSPQKFNGMAEAFASSADAALVPNAPADAALVPNAPADAAHAPAGTPLAPADAPNASADAPTS